MPRTNSRKYRRPTLFCLTQKSVHTTIDSDTTDLPGTPSEDFQEAALTSTSKIYSEGISSQDSLAVVVAAAENVVALIFSFVIVSN